MLVLKLWKFVMSNKGYKTLERSPQHLSHTSAHYERFFRTVGIWKGAELKMNHMALKRFN